MFTRFRKLILFVVGFSIPIQSESITLGPFQATAFKLAVAALLVLAGLQMAQRVGDRARDAKFFWVFVFGLSFAMALVMSLLAGLPAGPVLNKGTTMVALVSYYYLLGFTMRAREDLVLLLWALALGGAVTALPAVFGIQAADDQLAYGQRFVGLSGQANRFGSDMTVCLAVALGLFFVVRSTPKKAVLALCAVAALIGVGLSLSRAAFLSLGVMWVFWLYRSGRTGAIRWAVPAVLLGVGALMTAPDAVEYRFRTMVDPKLRERDGSIQERFVQFEFATKAFASNPVLGIGAGRFPVWARQQPNAQRLPFATVHSAYFHLAAEQGLFGLIPFLMILALTWSDFTKCFRSFGRRKVLRDPLLQEYATYALFLQVALLGRIVSGFFHQGHQSKALWTILALSPVLAGLVRARIVELGHGGEQREPDARAEFGSSAPRPFPAGGAPVR